MYIYTYVGVMYYGITSYLCDSEICAFWPKRAILNVCRFYLRMCGSTWGVAILCRYKLCELFLCDFQFYSHNRINNCHARINNQ